MGREFELALSRNSLDYAREVVRAVRRIQDKLAITYRESEDLGETMSYSQKLMSQQMKKFVAYLTHRMKSEFGVSDHEQEIEQIMH